MQRLDGECGPLFSKIDINLALWRRKISIFQLLYSSFRVLQNTTVWKRNWNLSNDWEGNFTLLVW